MALKWRREAKIDPNAPHHSCGLTNMFMFKKKDFEIVTSNIVLLAWNCPLSCTILHYVKVYVVIEDRCDKKKRGGGWVSKRSVWL